MYLEQSVSPTWCPTQTLDMHVAFLTLLGFLALHYLWYKQNALLDVRAAHVRLSGALGVVWGVCVV